MEAVPVSGWKVNSLLMLGRTGHVNEKNTEADVRSQNLERSVDKKLTFGYTGNPKSVIAGFSLSHAQTFCSISFTPQISSISSA